MSDNGRRVFVESSAIVGILDREDDQIDLIARIQAADTRITGVTNAVEAAFVLTKTTGSAERAKELVAEFLDKLEIQMVPVGADLYPSIMDAFARFGKGQGHPAQLNYSDCFSYALAKHHRAHLIYKGNDFAHAGL
jgi:ribonuclease VapC